MDETARTTDTSRHSGLPLAHWITQTEGLITARVAASLEEHGLTRAQWQMLNALTESPLSPEEVTAGFAPEMTETALAELQELVEATWVTVEGDLFTLTATGREAGERVAEAVDRLRAEAIGDLSQEDYETTLASLRTIARNLGHPEA